MTMTCTLSALGTLHDYYFSARGAFRTDNVYSTDLALNYNAPKVFGVELSMIEVIVHDGRQPQTS